MRKHTIAVIDDDPKLLKALGRLLVASGYRVELFGSAEEFLMDLATSQATCLIVDCQLGHLSGLQLSQHLAAADFQFPTIFMTGSDSSTIRKQALELGCVAFLQKPVHETQLLESIAKAMGSDSVRSDSAADIM